VIAADFENLQELTNTRCGKVA